MKETMKDHGQQAWEDFLNPEVLRSRLITASLFIAAFEVLKDSVVDRIRDFFCTGFDEGRDIIGPQYQTEVLSRNRSPVYASLAWLESMGAIEAADMAAFDRIKACRNHLAHRLLKLLWNEGMPTDLEERFDEMAALLRKIEVWWIREVEIPTNPDFDGREIDEAAIVPGPLIGLQVLQDIALGPDERSRFYWEEMKRRADRGGA